MLFHEIYGSYYNIVAQILEEAVYGRLTIERITEIATEKGFAESILSIPGALNSGEWQLLDENLETPLVWTPGAPLSLLQRRWMKAILQDPRMRLFLESDAELERLDSELEDVKPLYGPDTFVYFDRYSDGDPYADEIYVNHFRTVLQAFREKRKLRVSFVSFAGKEHSWQCIPHKLEYSAKDDKFRIQTFGKYGIDTINMARIRACSLLKPYTEAEFTPPADPEETVVLELTDERKALERAMLHFSHLKKETVKLEEGKYRITLYYHKDNDLELLIRILSFGPMIRVTGPESFVEMVRERLIAQKNIK